MYVYIYIYRYMRKLYTIISIDNVFAQTGRIKAIL